MWNSVEPKHTCPGTSGTTVVGAVMKWAVAQGYREDNPAGDVISAALPNNRVAAKHQRAPPHGIRSSPRDWAAECTDATREVCELALVHVNGDRVEAAYRHSDLFDRRRVLMNDWAAYVA